MMVECEVHTWHIRQVGRDVAIAHLDLSILHVLRMHELDVVDQVQLVEQHCAHEPIEVAARDEAVFFLTHGQLLRRFEHKGETMQIGAPDYMGPCTIPREAYRSASLQSVQSAARAL